MITTVNGAFNKFIEEIVDLDTVKTQRARRSRDWLYNQLKELPEKADNFPALYSGKETIGFGSFRRRTKIRPLDDIDLLLVFTGSGTTYIEQTNKIYLTVPESAERLRKLTNEDGTLNSRRMVEKVKNSLSKVNHYQNAELHRKQEAVTLKLSSYEWVFDIVPAFITAEDTFGKTYYIIPDGEGNWKKTDPRIDNDRATEINQRYNGNVLSFIRLIKYWNTNISPVITSSYLMENIVLNYLDRKLFPWTGRKDELKDFFNHLINNIHSSVQDPKGIQGDLNTLSWTERNAISNAANNAYNSIVNAIYYQNLGNNEKAIDYWGEVFGIDFPEYEG